jgi:FemAB-related protein (PEP-CTERM system-associated)
MIDALIDSMTTEVRPRGELAVRCFEPADARRWDRFVEECPAATFFHTIGWRTVLERVFRHRTHYLLAERDGAIEGVLPLAEVRSRLFGHSLVSLPFAVYGGPVAIDGSVEKSLVDAAVTLSDWLGVDHLELRNCRVIRPDWPTQDLYVTFRKALLPEVADNMLAIPRKQRAMVRKGMKAGLASVVDASPDRFFALYADNMRRHGTPPLPKSYFAQLQEVFGERCEILTVTDAGGRAVSGVVSFYFRDEVLPYYAGDTPQARELAANDFKYWELMRRSCERGVRVFDYGRSKRGTGSFDFKKNWGFEPTQLHYEYRLRKGDTIPQRNPLNPKYRAMVAMWRRLPLPVANALGPWLVRSLG